MSKELEKAKEIYNLHFGLQPLNPPNYYSIEKAAKEHAIIHVKGIMEEIEYCIVYYGHTMATIKRMEFWHDVLKELESL